MTEGRCQTRVGHKNRVLNGIQILHWKGTVEAHVLDRCNICPDECIASAAAMRPFVKLLLATLLVSVKDLSCCCKTARDSSGLCCLFIQLYCTVLIVVHCRKPGVTS